MNKYLFPILSALLFTQAAFAKDLDFEARSLALIKSKYKEPGVLKSDMDYSRMKLLASFWLDKKGKVSDLKLLRDHEICFIPAPGEPKAKPSEHDYKGLTSKRNTESAETAFLSAIKNAQPYSVTGISYPPPYPVFVEYAPGAKESWTLSLSPPPAAPPLRNKKQ